MGDFQAGAIARLELLFLACRLRGELRGGAHFLAQVWGLGAKFLVQEP